MVFTSLPDLKQERNYLVIDDCIDGQGNLSSRAKSDYFKRWWRTIVRKFHAKRNNLVFELTTSRITQANAKEKVGVSNLSHVHVGTMIHMQAL